MVMGLKEDSLLFKFKTTALKGAVWDDDSVGNKAKTGEWQISPSREAYNVNGRMLQMDLDNFGGLVHAVEIQTVCIPDQDT